MYAGIEIEREQTEKVNSVMSSYMLDWFTASIATSQSIPECQLVDFPNFVSTTGW